MDQIRASDIRALTIADAAAYRTCRLRALRDHPEAFGMSYEEEAARPIERTIDRIKREWNGLDNFMLGAFNGVDLIGTAHFHRDQYVKSRHIGYVTAMYVAPEARGQRVGRRLMTALIDRTRRIDDLEQIHLSVTTINTAARNLYRSLGFQSYGVERRAIKWQEQYYDLDLMVLWLDMPGGKQAG